MGRIGAETGSHATGVILTNLFLRLPYEDQSEMLLGKETSSKSHVSATMTPLSVAILAFLMPFLS